MRIEQKKKKTRCPLSDLISTVDICDYNICLVEILIDRSSSHPRGANGSTFEPEHPTQRRAPLKHEGHQRMEVPNALGASEDDS